MVDDTRGTGIDDSMPDDAGAGDRFGRAREIASDAYGRASGAVRDGYNSARERIDQVDIGGMTEQVRTYVRSNPAKALVVSIGVGFVIGLLLRRDDED